MLHAVASPSYNSFSQNQSGILKNIEAVFGFLFYQGDTECALLDMANAGTVKRKTISCFEYI
jgi:hypothetical protein